jgi:hypothetical protein
MIHAAVGSERTGRDEVRAMFQRVLAAWAVDALSLRRRGLDRPCSRDRGGATPGGWRGSDRLAIEAADRRWRD